MSRYIDADALIDRLDYCVKEGMGSTIAFTFKHMVEEAPSIDIEPKRGEWIESEYTGRIYGIYRCQYKCSCCEYVPMYRGEPIVPTTGTLLFCPNCGADMRERSK